MNQDTRAIELIHARIDGVITEEENTELEALLAADADLRRQFEELKQVASRLDGLPAQAPPDGMRFAVRRELDKRDDQAAPAARPRGRRRAALRYAYAVAAGLVLGVLGYHVAIQGVPVAGKVDPAETAGTMATIFERGKPLIFDDDEIDLPQVSGDMVLERKGGGVSLTLDLDSASPVDVVLKFEPGSAWFRSLQQHEGEIEALDVEMNSNENTVTWSQQGSNRVEMAVSLPGGRSAEFEVELFSAGERLHGAVLRANDPD